MAEFNLKLGSSEYFFRVLTVPHYRHVFNQPQNILLRQNARPKSTEKGKRRVQGKSENIQEGTCRKKGKRKMEEETWKDSVPRPFQIIPFQKVHLPICKHQTIATTRGLTWLGGGSNTVFISFMSRDYRRVRHSQPTFLNQ